MSGSDTSRADSRLTAGRQALSIEAFVDAARARLPQEHIAGYRVRTLGDSEALFARVLPRLLDGTKTGTFSPDVTGTPGEYWVVTHFDGTPAVLWRVVDVEVVPFGDISEEHLRLEGPALRQLPAWREVHLAAWHDRLQGLAPDEIERIPIHVQRFVVLHPAPAH